MKKIIQITLFLSIFASINALNAQLQVSVRLGVNVSNTEFRNPPQLTNNLTGFTIGVPVEIDISDYFSAQSEVCFVQKGYKSTINGRNVTANWGQTNVFGKLRLGSDKFLHTFLYFGPSLDVRLTTKGQFDRSYDLGLNFGGQIVFKRAYLDVRYQRGLTDLDTDESLNFQVEKYARSLAVTLGFRFYKDKRNNDGNDAK